jgi:hypothetical protein
MAALYIQQEPSHLTQCDLLSFAVCLTSCGCHM